MNIKNDLFTSVIDSVLTLGLSKYTLLSSDCEKIYLCSVISKEQW